MHSIVERIEFQRKKLNISQKELCQKCNIIDTTYSSWKNRNRLPSLDDIIALSHTLKTSIEWLITGTETTNSATDLPKDERQLLQHYNHCSQEGKNRIMEQAEFIASKYPQQGKSSEYKIG